MNSERSSPPPEKPPECSSEIWNVLGDIINNEVSEQDAFVGTCWQSEEVVSLEIVDVDENGEVVNAVTEQSNLLVANDSPEENRPEAENETKTTLTRKRQRNPSSWKQTVRKTKRQRGEEYVDTKGQLRPCRKVKSQTCRTDKCPFKCAKIINEKERQYIHDQFWKLDDTAKTHFYSKHVKRIQAIRKRTKETVSKKKFSYEYYFFVAGVKLRVCQEYFFNTLNISKQRIYYFFKINKNEATPNPPKHGKHKKKFINCERKDEVRAHINSFPAVESHYCRANSKKKYLERGLNLQRMYDLYRSSSENPVKFNIYSTIFNSEFNIGFFKPKKDLCDKCELFKVNKEPTSDEIRKQNEHMQQKRICKLERDRDRTRFSDDIEVGVITFDLQNTYSLPKANVSNFYYKTKLSCYNLTAHLDKTKVVYNAIWHEFAAGRGGNHIAAAVIRILKQVVLDNPHLKKLVLWSDSCVAQNRNSIMSFALQFFLQSKYSSTLETIEQKFSEAGHGNVQEIDNAHSCIERHIKNIEIWSPISLIRQLIAIPSSWKLKFKVIQMMPADYLNFQKISKMLNYNTVPYTRLKHIVYSKAEPNNIKFRETFEGDFQYTKIEQVEAVRKDKKSREGRCERRIIPYDFSNEVPLAAQNIEISALKRKHLTEMKAYIPNDTEKAFYDAILTSNKMKSASTTNTETPKLTKKVIKKTDKVVKKTVKTKNEKVTPKKNTTKTLKQTGKNTTDKNTQH